jgi:hypothetical protein
VAQAIPLDVLQSTKASQQEGALLMCRHILINNQVYATVAELRSVLPIIIPCQPPPTPFHEDGCFCQVDVEATAKANGYRCEGQVDYRLTRIPSYNMWEYAAQPLPWYWSVFLLGILFAWLLAGWFLLDGRYM